MLQRRLGELTTRLLHVLAIFALGACTSEDEAPLPECDIDGPGGIVLELGPFYDAEPEGIFEVGSVTATSLVLHQGDFDVEVRLPDLDGMKLPQTGQSITWARRTNYAHISIRAADDGALLFVAGDILDPLPDVPARFIPGDEPFFCRRGSLRYAHAGVEVDTDTGPIRLGTGDQAKLQIEGRPYAAWVPRAFRTVADTAGQRIGGAHLYLAPPAQ